MNQTMTGRERILAAMEGRPTDVTPVGIDYMRLYLAERAERAYVEAYRPRLERQGRVSLDPDEDVYIRAQAYLQAYECFQERHDWLQVAGAPATEVIRGRELALQDGKVLEIDTTGECRQMLRRGQDSKCMRLCKKPTKPTSRPKWRARFASPASAAASLLAWAARSHWIRRRRAPTCWCATPVGTVESPAGSAPALGIDAHASRHKAHLSMPFNL